MCWWIALLLALLLLDAKIQLRHAHRSLDEHELGRIIREEPRQ